MWELIYEDRFGFGDDRDPPTIEKTGDNDSAGFCELWRSVLSESIAGSAANPAEGFAGFTLALINPGAEKAYVQIDTKKNLASLARIKRDMAEDEIRNIALSHYEAYRSGKEEEFWNSPDWVSEGVRIYAVKPGKSFFIKKMTLYILLLIFVNVAAIFCIAGFFHLLSEGRMLHGIIAALFAFVFMLLNVAAGTMSEFIRRFRNPEKFYIGTDGENFIHASGSRIFSIPLNSIKNFREEEYFTRSGIQRLFVVAYKSDSKEKTYQFFRQLSPKDIIYDLPAQKVKDLLGISGD